MKIQLHILFAFLLTQLMGVQTLLAGPVSGFVIFDQDTQYLVDNGISKAFVIKPSNQNIEKVLFRLNNFDRVSGQANTNSENIVILESIDFVSLRKLLGSWSTNNHKNQIIFSDHNTLLWIENDEVIRKNYYLAPGPHDSWMLFMSDLNKVTMSRLVIEESPSNIRLNIEVLDPNSGDIMEKLVLDRQI